MVYAFVVVDVYDKIHLKRDVRPAFEKEGRSTADVEEDIANIIEGLDKEESRLYCIERANPNDPESVNEMLNYYPGRFPKDALYMKEHFSPFTGNVYRHSDGTIAKFETMLDKGIDTVVIAGYDLTVCVINTAIDFAEKGYNVVMVKDLLLTDNSDISETMKKLSEYENVRFVDSFDAFKN